LGLGRGLRRPAATIDPKWSTQRPAATIDPKWSTQRRMVS
jgi:hypothetical protein